MIKEQRLEQEPELNNPGLLLQLKHKSKEYTVLLFGGERLATKIGDDVYVQIRRKRFPLPFEVELIDFQRKMHGGTGMAKSFKSFVFVRKESEERRVH